MDKRLLLFHGGYYEDIIISDSLGQLIILTGELDIWNSIYMHGPNQRVLPSCEKKRMNPSSQKKEGKARGASD